MHIQIPNRGSGARPYKVYTALLSQSGTNAPVATVLENTLGGTPVWGYDAEGVYTLTLSGEWTTNKTAVFISNNAQWNINPLWVSYAVTDNNVINFYGWNNGDSANWNTFPYTIISVEVRVYY